MSEIGYFLSSEEHGPTDLVDYARQVEEAGFSSVWLSDHYHPWNDRQGQASFVWSVIGGIAATTQLRLTTAVTCPTVRIQHRTGWRHGRPLPFGGRQRPGPGGDEGVLGG